VTVAKLGSGVNGSSSVWLAGLSCGKDHAGVPVRCGAGCRQAEA